MRTALWGYTGLTTAAALVFPFLPIEAKDVVYPISSMVVILAVLWGLRTQRPSVRTPWLLLIAGLSSSMLADLGYNTVHAVTRAEIPFPSVFDAFYLLYYPFVVAAMVSFLRAMGRPDRAAWVDASIWTIGVAAVLWLPLFAPYVYDADPNVLSTTVALAYPMLDLVLLLMVLRMVAGRASLHPASVLLTASMLLLIVVDFVYAVRLADGTYMSGELTDSGWMVVNVLLGASALHPSMTRMTDQVPRTATRRWSKRRLQWLLIPALVAPTLLVVQALSGELEAAPGHAVGSGIFTAVAVGLLLVLITGRAAALLRVAELRSAQLADRKTELEQALADRERVDTELRRRVELDALTGLASRDHFMEKLNAAIETPDAHALSVAFLDLDDFKSINDTLGHDAGDLLLIEVANRMRAVLDDSHVIARLGGDEFAVIVPGGVCADTVAARLAEAVCRPFRIHGQEIRPGVSIGIASAHAGTASLSDLLREADVAMYDAKRAGGGWARYHLGMTATLLHSIDVQNRLVAAVERDEIEPWFQPVVDLASGRLLGFEALTRWSAEGGVAATSSWLPLAEQSGLIVEIDRMMMRRSLAQLASWRRDAPDSELELAINISGRTLQVPGIEDEILHTLHSLDVPAHRLIVEVTEGVLIDDESVGERLGRLREAGIRIALDDFGTGWSSLSYLRRFPIDHLKLDRSFTADLGINAEASTIPAAIAQLARGLSLGVVAEGVETMEQRQRLLDLGFRIGQGYLFGRAQRAADLRAKVLESRPLLDLGELTSEQPPFARS
jgi:diguanylate cyclase